MRHLNFETGHHPVLSTYDGHFVSTMNQNEGFHFQPEKLYINNINHSTAFCRLLRLLFLRVVVFTAAAAVTTDPPAPTPAPVTEGGY